MSSTLPMAAIFTRNKMIGWTSVLFAIQSWLSETPSQRATTSTPAYFSVGMAVLSLGVVSFATCSTASDCRADICLGVYAPFPTSAGWEGGTRNWNRGASGCWFVVLQCWRSGRA
jgi:hypothetical protein